mgnify:FL=1
MAFEDKQKGYDYINKYHKEKYDRITVMAEKGKKEKYRAAAEKRGMTLSGFIQECVDRELEKDR